MHFQHRWGLVVGVRLGLMLGFRIRVRLRFKVRVTGERVKGRVKVTVRARLESKTNP